jgi:hypothetical protein
VSECLGAVGDHAKRHAGRMQCTEYLGGFGPGSISP